jgi:hypothetical protein
MVTSLGVRSSAFMASPRRFIGVRGVPACPVVPLTSTGTRNEYLTGNMRLDTMRSTVKRTVLAAGVVCFLVVWSTPTDQDALVAQQRTPITVTRLYTGPDGQSHAEDVEVKLMPGGANTELSETIKVTGMRFLRVPPGWVNDWHTVPQREYVIPIRGRGEIELVGGHKIPVESGRIGVAEDVTGKGHISRNVGTEDLTYLIVQLADQRRRTAPP